MMRPLLIAMAMLVTGLAGPAVADVQLTAANVLGPPGSIVVVAVDIASTGGSLPSSLNFDLLFDPDRLSVSPQEVTCGAACWAAQKGAYAALVEPGQLRVIVFGGTGAIPDGELVGVPFAIASAAATGRTFLHGQDEVIADAAAALLPSSFVDGSICIGDDEAACDTCGNGSMDSGEECGESGLPPCADDLLCVQCRCRQRGDCALNGGGVDLFDVLAEIDMVLARVAPDATQQVVCDADCNEQIDLFDVLTGIDVLLGKRTLPLLCSVP